MKRIAIAALVAAATLIMAGSALAQDYVAQATIPFSFSVNNIPLPAGTYRIWSASDGRHMLNLESRDKGVHILVLSMSVQDKPQNSSVLVFHEYGDKYFLSNIRSEESSTDTQFVTTGAEKRARAEAEEAALRTNDNVTVAMNGEGNR